MEDGGIPLGLGVDTVFKIPKHNNAGLGPVRKSRFVWFDNKDTHGRQRFWYEALSTERKILLLVDSFKNIKPL